MVFEKTPTTSTDHSKTMDYDVDGPRQENEGGLSETL